MAENAALIPDSEFVRVADKETKVEWPNPIPKSWIGTALAPNVKKVRGATTEATGGPTQPPSGEPPAKSADKPAWVAYAVEKGMPVEEAEAATKEQLIATYGAPTSTGA